jgi:carbamoyltransferase
VKYILGISSYYHDSAATLIRDGEIICAVQEERFSRKKHDSRFPEKSIKYILRNYSLSLNEIEAIVFYEKPFLKFERLLETYIAFAPKGFKSFCASIPIWLREKLYQKNLIKNELKKIESSFNDEKKIKFSEHHLSHAASAFFPSPFEDAIILTLDGVGEWSTTNIAVGSQNKIKIMEEINFPHSLGLLYSAFTYFLGFKVNSGEYKVMGLAPYGKPIYKKLITDNLIDIKDDGSFKLNMKFFDFATDLKMTNERFNRLFNCKVRVPDQDELNNFHMDVAASLQSVTEDIILKICKYIRDKYKIENLCLAGGVALNCVANGKILNEKIFKNIWIQPAAGDAGGSLGAALAYWYLEKNNTRVIDKSIDSMKGSYLGPQFDNDFIETQLRKLNSIYTKLEDKQLFQTTAKHLSEGKAVGWFQGRMEFGPRALGSRSILADARNPDMQKQLNLKVKYRESFRPFAPIVLEEDMAKYFDIPQISPYMLFVSNVRNEIRQEMSESQNNLFGIKKLNVSRSSIPAVTHVDFSARIQTINEERNGKIFNLLNEFKKITGCSVLVNTSFNIRGEPIVCNIEDAYKCFMGTELDILVIENFILLKKEQKFSNDKSYRENYELD